MQKPNILLICIDCLRADKIFNSKAHIPNLRKLLTKGTAFTNAITVATTTSPSIASLLTGKYPSQHGIQSLVGYKLNPSIETLPQILVEKGYDTCAMVTGPLSEDLGCHRGFKDYRYRKKGENIHTDWKNELLAKLDGFTSQPWMLFLHLWELHDPRVVPNKFNHSKYGNSPYERALAGVDFQLGSILEQIDLNNTIVIILGDHGESIAEDTTKKVLVKLWKNRRTRSAAQAMGKAIDYTRKFIPFGTFDHYSPGFHGQFEGHGFHIYDFLVKVPVLLVGNGLFPENLKIHKQISLVDIMPTLSEIVGRACPSHGPEQGRDLLPLISKPESHEWEEIAYMQACGIVLCDHNNWLIGLRTPKWKFIRPYIGTNHGEELYDLEHDPLELRNIAKKHRSLATKFNALLETMLESETSSAMTADETKSLSNKLKDLGYL